MDFAALVFDTPARTPAGLGEWLAGLGEVEVDPNGVEPQVVVARDEMRLYVYWYEDGEIESYDEFFDGWPPHLIPAHSHGISFSIRSVWLLSKAIERVARIRAFALDSAFGEILTSEQFLERVRDGQIWNPNPANFGVVVPADR
jgi:hypothetical protein